MIQILSSNPPFTEFLLGFGMETIPSSTALPLSIWGYTQAARTASYIGLKIGVCSSDLLYLCFSLTRGDVQ